MNEMRQSGKALTTLLGVLVGVVVIVLLGLLAREFYVYVSVEPEPEPKTSPVERLEPSKVNEVAPEQPTAVRSSGAGQVGPGEIGGMVKTEAGDPIEGARVLITRFGGDGEKLASLKTDDMGRFKAKNISGRFCQVKVSARNLVPQVETRVLPGEKFLNFRMEEGGQVIGVVKGALDGDPLIGARVKGRAYIVRQRQWHFEVETDASGAFVIDAAPARSIQLEVECPGYETQVATGVVVKQGAQVMRNFRLKKGHAVQGTVVDGENGNGIPGASISFGMRLLNERKVLSDDDGHFSIDAIARGIQFFQVEAEGFGPHRQSLNVKNAEDEGLRFELFKSRSLSGHVEGPDGEKVAGAQLFLGEDSAYIPPRAEAVSETNKTGQFKIENLTAGHDYFIMVRHPDFPDKVSGKVEVIRYLEEDLIIRLARGITLLGRVQNRDGDPVPNARIMVSDIVDPDEPDERFPATPKRLERDRGRSDEEGVFVIANLTAGAKRVVVSASPEYLSKTVETQELVAGQESEELLVVLSAGEVISGTVVGIDGNPIPDVRLQASSTNQKSPSFGNSTTKEDGKFRIPQLTGDSFKISARKPGYSVEFLDEVPAGSEGLEIILKKNGTVSGTARTKMSGEPVGRFLVRMTRTDSPDAPFSRSRQFTSDEGFFFFPDIMPGSYRLEVTAKEFAPGILESVYVSAGEETKGVLVELPEGAVLSGRVTDTQGGSVPRSTVFAKSVTPGGAVPTVPGSRKMPQSKSALVNEDGTYKIGGLGDGEYEVYASAPKYSVADTVVVRVVDGGTTERDFLLSLGGALQVTAIQDGEPVYRAKVDILDGGKGVYPSRIKRIIERYPENSDQRTRFTERLHRTDRNGFVKILNLPVGTFSVVVTSEDGTTARETATLQEGGEVQITVELR